MSSCMSFIFLIGWHFDIPYLLQMPPSTWPIPYLTTLSFLFSGLALFSLFSLSRFFLSKILGLTVFFLGFERTIEFFYSQDFKVNLIANKILLHPIPSTQMTLAAAIGFILVGMVFTIWSKDKSTLTNNILILFFSVLILFLGALGIFLNLSHIVEQGPHVFVIHFYTGVELFILGFCFVYFKLRLNPIDQINENKWLVFKRNKSPMSGSFLTSLLSCLHHPLLRG